MLASVSDRIQQEENELKKAKSKKKKKKDKKEKKKKKKKKKRSSSSSSDESDAGSAWVEKTEEVSDRKSIVKGPKLQRDDWMTSPLDFGGLGGMSRAELKAKKQAEEEEKKKQQSLLDMPGQHERELNPYWKDGGCGAPTAQPSATGAVGPASVAGDGGVGWLRKALRRCEEQAQEEGRSVEVVAADRYGSLKELKAKLKEAEEAVQKQRHKSHAANNRTYAANRDRPRYPDRNRSEGEQGNRSRDRSKSREERGNNRRRRSSSSSSDDSEEVESRSPSRDRSKYRDRSKDRDRRTYKERSRSRERRKKYKDRSRSRSSSRDDSRRHRSRSHSRDRQRCINRSRSRSRSRGKVRRNRSRSDSRERRAERNRKRSRSRSRDRSRPDGNRRRSRSRSREGKYGDRREDKTGDRERGTHGKRESESGEFRQGSRLKALSGRFKKPGEDSDRNDSREGSGRRMFQKPGDDTERATDNSSSRRYTSSQPSWRKKAFVKPGEFESNGNGRNDKQSERPRTSNRDSSRTPERTDKWRKVKDEKSSDKRKQRMESSSSSSESESSSSESEKEEDQSPAQQLQQRPPPKVLTEQEMNQLGAKLVRAEIMGNEALVSKIKLQLEQARAAAETAAKQPVSRGESDMKRGGEEEGEEDGEQVVVLTRTDKMGNVRPLADRKHPQEKGKSRRKKQKIETHVGDKGERLRYFQDDDKLGLKDLVEQEKLGTAEDANMMFARLAGRSGEKTSDDYQMDDMFISRASHKEADSKQEDRDRASAIFEHKKVSEAMEKCQFCFNKTPKHLIIAIGIKCYVCLPNHRSLTDGHCLIVPMQHVSQGTVVDEDVWDEIQVFRKGLSKMFEDQEEDCVFMEMSRNLRHHPHMVLECIPLPKEVGDLSPIYFKKAIQECEAEWSQNTKLVDLRDRDVRRAIPKGFPYFSVDFGLQSGFAHVIEDEKVFPTYFGREIVGGMLDVGPELWRKPHKENFEEQRKKVLKFAEWWKPYYWTHKIKSKEDT